MSVDRSLPYISKFVIQRDPDNPDKVTVTLGYRNEFTIKNVVKDCETFYAIGYFKLYKNQWPNLCHLIYEFSNGLYGCDIFVLRRPLHDEGFIKTLEVIQNIHIKRMLEDEKMFNR